MKRSMLTALAILALALAACRAPAGGAGSDSPASSEAPAQSTAPAESAPPVDPYDY